MAALDLPSLLASLSLPPLPELASFPAAEPVTRPSDIARLYLAEILASIVPDSTPQSAYNSIIPPADIYAGDFAVILPKLLGKGKADWNVVGVELVQKFPATHPLFNLPFQEGVHLRIWLKTTTLYHLIIPYILSLGTSYGTPSPGAQVTESKKTTVLEFSSPNLATPFSPRHLRSTLHGHFLNSLLTTSTHPVHKLNYLGDWGKNLALLGVGFARYCPEESLADASIAHLEDVYRRIDEEFKPEQAASKKARDDKTGEEAEIEGRGLFKERNEWFTALEHGESAQVDFFTRVRELYVHQYTALYARLGVTFDSYSGESSIKVDTMAEIEGLLKEKGVLEEAEGGSLVVDLKKHGKDKKVKSGMCIIRDRGGSSTYLLRDLAGVVERSRMNGEGGVEKCVYVVESGHVVHFGRVQVLLELMGLEELAGKVQHVGFADVAGADDVVVDGGEGLLERLLAKAREGVEATLSENEEKAAILRGGGEVDAEILGVNALLVQELGVRRGADYTIDVPKATTFETGTALDLMYWYARLSAVLKESAEEKDDEVVDAKEGLGSEEQNNLLRLLVQYPDVALHALKSLEAAGLVAFLVSVTGQVAGCLDEEEEEEEVAEEKSAEEEATEAVQEPQDKGPISNAEVKLYEATKVVLENGLKLLGLRGIGS